MKVESMPPPELLEADVLVLLVFVVVFGVIALVILSLLLKRLAASNV